VTSLWGAVASRVRGISLGQVMIGSFLIICVAYFFRYLNPQLMRWIIIAGLLLFFASFVLSLRRSNSPISRERRWRGQRVDYDEPNLAERLRSWFDRSRRGRRW
jgi:multisubunit Na+/H+ antiporter MnhE subunit